MRRILLFGGNAAIAAYLDVLHCCCDVHGVREDDGVAEVFFDGDLPPLGEHRVTAQDLPPEVAGDRRTGLEADVAIRVSDRILVRPPWVGTPAGFLGLEIVVPRGMAFGSGEHGSTQAALLALDELWPSPPPARALDVGTGSGVLARFLQLRGAGSVSACDVEEPAVAAARLLLGDSDVRLGGPDRFAPERFDLVVANLDARQLATAWEELLARVTPAGTLVVSGLRPAEQRAFEGRMQSEPIVRRERLGYVALGWGLGGTGA
ncbi:MAG: 50S ribosomal protein L11 methyltransferase [Planctomycetes bacterium]|nr:50S ribosomal protein L11 methyltransferase [Planctomycetota bacterium]